MHTSTACFSFPLLWPGASTQSSVPFQLPTSLIFSSLQCQRRMIQRVNWSLSRTRTWCVKSPWAGCPSIAETRIIDEHDGVHGPTDVRLDPDIGAEVLNQIQFFCSVPRYPTHIVLVLACLAALLILLAFNAALWYWCLTHRYARKTTHQQPDPEMAAAADASRASTPFWGNRTVSKLSFHESDSQRSTVVDSSPQEQLSRWRWPSPNVGATPTSTIVLSVPVPPEAPVAPFATVPTASPSRSASPVTIRAARPYSPSPSRAGTPSRLDTLDVTAAYQMPYDSTYALPLPSPPPPGGLAPPPPARLQVRTAVEPRERGRRSPLST